MVSYRPVGVTILAAFIILSYGIIFLVGLAMVLYDFNPLPYLWMEGELVSIVGFIILIWALVKMSLGFGLLRLKKKAWKSAMGVFVIGLIIDLFIAPGQVLLGVIIIMYLLIVKRHFTY